MSKPPPRLFLEPMPGGLAAGARVPLPQAQGHYLTRVLRLATGAAVCVFDGISGEWLAALDMSWRGEVALIVERETRRFEAPPPIILLFAMIRREKVELILEKGTELGVTDFVPVLTERTQQTGARLAPARARHIVIEAAEQCERLDIPAIHWPARSLAEVLEENIGTPLIFCDEASDALPDRWGAGAGAGIPLLHGLRFGPAEPLQVLIGPEGGFSSTERATLRQRPDTVAVTLGPQILKAETAAIAALAVIATWRDAAR